MGKEKPSEYFAWGLNLCLCSNAGGIFIDMVPEDGVLRELSESEEMVLGHSVETMAKSRVKGFGTVSRIKCGPQTTPEIFYLGVVHALRQIEAWAQTERELEEKTSSLTMVPNATSPPLATKTTTQASPYILLKTTPQLAIDAATPATTGIWPVATPMLSVITPATMLPTATRNQHSLESLDQQTTNSDPNLLNPASVPLPPPAPPLQSLLQQRFAPHILILQDIDQAPARTLQCITEMLHCKRLSVPPSAASAAAMGILEPIDLPHHFLLLATSCRLPAPSALVSSSPPQQQQQQQALLSDKLLAGFLIRLSIVFPSRRSSSSSATPLQQPASNANLNFLHRSQLVALTRSEYVAAMERIPNVYIGPLLVRHVRSVCSRLGQHTNVICNVTPQGLDALFLAVKAQAALAMRDFAIPDDFYACVLEVIAHRITITCNANNDDDDDGEDEEYEPAPPNAWYQARILLASVVSSLQTLK